MPPKLGSSKKTMLLINKQKLLQELDYYDRKIKATRRRLGVAPTSLIEDDDSSDSDTSLLELFQVAPSIFQLKRKEAMLKTCLEATQELIELENLEVLQHQIDNLDDPPELNRDPLVEEHGMWRDVAAECCVDVVPFSITFYTFRADRKFAPILYRGLKVIPHKTPHEVELANSVLHRLHTPSEALKVLTNYSKAYRSRSSTLKQLDDKFGAALHMDLLPGGGYVVKCGSALEVKWSLQNEKSPIAPFQHKLEIEIDHMGMEEQYIEIITQEAHKQLSDPSKDPDPRTQLLVKIIGTCLQGCPQIAADTEVMAPPKPLPKKAKPKNKEDKVTNQKATKRPAQEEISNDTATQNIDKNNKIEQEDELPPKSNNVTVRSAKSGASNKKSQKNVDSKKKSDKNVVQSVDNELNTEKDNVATAKNDKLITVIENTRISVRKSNKFNEKEIETEQNEELPKSAKITNRKQKISKPNQDITKCNMQNEENLGADKNNDIIPKSTKSGTDIPKKIMPIRHKEKTNNVSAKNNTNNTDKTKTKNIVKHDKNIPDSNEATKQHVNPPKVPSKTNTSIPEKNEIKNTNNTEQNTKITNKKSASHTNKENTVQNVATTTNVKKTISNADKLKKPLNEQNPKISKPTTPAAKPTKLQPTQKDVKTGNIEKGLSVINTGQTSKPIRVSQRLKAKQINGVK